MSTFSTGTVSIGANATSLTGSGTAWNSSGVRAGDILLLAGNAIPIAAVTGNTAITLARPWPGAAQAGSNDDILLIDDDIRTLVAANLLLQQLTNGTLTSLAGLASAADRMPYFSGANTMARADLTAEARSLLASTLLSRNGNNLVTPASARLTGGVVTQSDQDATSGRLLKVGDFGLGTKSLSLIANLDAPPMPLGTYRWGGSGSTGTPPSGTNFGIIEERPRVGNSMGAFRIYRDYNSSRVWVRRWNGTEWLPWVADLNGGNTTVDSNGFVKAASPILRLFGDGSIEEPVQPTGADVARDGTGLYRISGTQGLAQSGWQIEVPRDHNGNILCHVETAAGGGVLTVVVSEPHWSNGRWTAGALIDVPAGRWIDIRLHEDPASPPVGEE